MTPAIQNLITAARMHAADLEKRADCDADEAQLWVKPPSNSHRAEAVSHSESSWSDVHPMPARNVAVIGCERENVVAPEISISAANFWSLGSVSTSDCRAAGMSPVLTAARASAVVIVPAIASAWKNCRSEIVSGTETGGD